MHIPRLLTWWAFRIFFLTLFLWASNLFVSLICGQVFLVLSTTVVIFLQMLLQHKNDAYNNVCAGTLRLWNRRSVHLMKLFNFDGMDSFYTRFSFSSLNWMCSCVPHRRTRLAEHCSKNAIPELMTEHFESRLCTESLTRKSRTSFSHCNPRWCRLN